MTRQTATYEVPLTVTFTVGASPANGKTREELAEIRARHMARNVADATHVEDFSIDIDGMERLAEA